LVLNTRFDRLVNEWSVKNMTPEETPSNATLLFIV